MANMRETKMQQWTEWHCHICKKRLNKWDERCCNALKERPTCEKCLAAKYNKTIEEFNQYLDEWLHIRECQGGK